MISKYRGGEWLRLSGCETADLLPLCNGAYQIDFILGNQAVSGSTLQGRAARYIGKYRKSLQGLFLRLESAGFEVTTERVGKRNVVTISKDTAAQ